MVYRASAIASARSGATSASLSTHSARTASLRTLTPPSRSSCPTLTSASARRGLSAAGAQTSARPRLPGARVDGRRMRRPHDGGGSLL